MSMIIHHAPQSRSTRLLWLLEELGADYRIHYVDILRREGQGRTDPANPHPLKQAPALEIDGQVLIESVLIFLFMTDRHPEAGLAPGPADPRRAEYLSWLGLYNRRLERDAEGRLRRTGPALAHGDPGRRLHPGRLLGPRHPVRQPAAVVPRRHACGRAL